MQDLSIAGCLRAQAVLLAAAVLAAGCGPRDPYAGQVRGHALAVAALTPGAEAAVYAAAIDASFDPGTPLLLDPQYLPRSAGWSGGDPVPEDVRKELRGRGIVQGTCKPPRTERAVPVCAAADPGYVVRFSPVFHVRGDTVEVYIAVVKYRTAPGQVSQALRFEKGYQAVGTGGTWRVVREARLAPPL